MPGGRNPMASWPSAVLLRPPEESAAARTWAAAQMAAQKVQRQAPAARWTLELHVQATFEEALDLRWHVTAQSSEANETIPPLEEITVEMVIDRMGPGAEGPPQPAKDAMVKRVKMGNGDTRGSVQNMPSGRYFLVSVVGTLAGPRAQVRSPWVRTATLDPGMREKELSNIDPTDMPRLHCNHCPCVGYVPFRFQANSSEKMRCRRCGCCYTFHEVIDALHTVRQKDAELKERLQRASITPLPEQAVTWDDRECLLWAQTDGAFHPRNCLGESRSRSSTGGQAGPGGPEGPAGKRGRVSVVTPTTEARHRFHKDLWASFKAQDWPDTELIVVETYHTRSSDFFAKLAKKEKRLIYVKFKRKVDRDFSIGLKRNLGIHLATGEFIAHFDDDDLYAPRYLSTMVEKLKAHSAHAITLSSWYIFNVKSSAWGFCDAIAWGWSHGYDEDSHKVRSWAYGYGFSYVYRRQAALDQPYEDCNMGEDFNFVTQLQRQRCRGDTTVALVRDDFGICLHLQHGQNTSETFPIRDVLAEEAQALDVVELSRAVEDHPAFRALPARQELQAQPALQVHTPGRGALWVNCNPGASVQEFRNRLEKIWTATGSYEVYCVPPLGAATRAERDGLAVRLLGIPCLEASLESREDTKAAREQMQLVARVQAPLGARDRIGLRVGELWLEHTPEDRPEEPTTQEATLQVPAEAQTETFDVQVTCQRSDVKRFANKEGAVTARLDARATVARLREAMGEALPASARVLVEREGEGLQPLQEADPVLPKVTVTEFKGRRAFYVLFNDSHTRLIFSMLRDFFQRPENQKKLDQMQGHPDKHNGYSTRLLGLLVQEVYPSILHRLGLPDDHLGGAPIIMDGLAMHRRFDLPSYRPLTPAHLELAERWLEVEMLMRNKVQAQFCHSSLEHLRHRFQQQEASACPEANAEPEPDQGPEADAELGGEEDSPWRFN